MYFKDNDNSLRFYDGESEQLTVRGFNYQLKNTFFINRNLRKSEIHISLNLKCTQMLNIQVWKIITVFGVRYPFLEC